MSKLKTYLLSNGIKQTDFARIIGVGQAAISKFSTNEITPSLEIALLIERETGGAVPVTCWVNLPEIKKAS